MAKLSQARWRSYSLLLLNTILWGAAFVIVKPAFDFTTPSRFLFYRYLIASFLILPVIIGLWPKFKQAVSKKKRFSKLSQIFLLELMGSGLALAILYSGLNLTSALEANLLGTTLPIFVTLGSIFILKEKISRHKFLGLGVAFIGTIFLTAVPFISLNGQFTQLSIWGNLMILFYNFTNIFYFPLAKKIYFGLPKFFVSGLAFYIALLVFATLSYLELQSAGAGFWPVIYGELTNFKVFGPAFYMGVFGSIIGLTAYIKGQEGVTAAEASFFWYLQPLVYIPLGFMILGDKINPSQIVALIFIFSGVFWAERKK